MTGKIRLMPVLVIALGFILFWSLGYYQGSKQKPLVPAVSVAGKTAPAQLCGVDKARLSSPTTFGNKQYLIYQRSSMNVLTPPGTVNSLDSGVLAVDPDSPDSCRKLLAVYDENPAKNNIYEIYSDDLNLYVLIVDQIGAGSGEGHAKILKSGDGAKTWSSVACFYYTPESWVTLKNYLAGGRPKLKLLNPDNAYCRNFYLGTDGGRLK